MPSKIKHTVSSGYEKKRFPLFTVCLGFLALWASYLWEPRIPLSDNIFCFVIGTFYSIYGHVHTAGSNRQHIDGFRFLANVANNFTFTSSHMTINEDIWVPRSEGSGLINVVSLRPRHIPEDVILPLVLWHHGGGMVVGKALDGSIPMNMLRQLNVTILSLNYRLAPEHTFPAAPDDALTVLKYFTSNPEITRALGADPTNMVISGESAGGNLAAGLAQAARDLGIPVKFQALFIPMLKYESTTDSYRENADCPILPIETALWFWERYVPQPEMCRNNSRCEPFVGDLSGLAPALVYTASCDVFRDEGYLYHQRLRDANIPSTYIGARGSHFGVTMFEHDHLARAFSLIQQHIED